MAMRRGGCVGHDTTVPGAQLTLYELLDVKATAQEQEIASAFKRAAKRWHPDLNLTLEATERMQSILSAYEVLRDPTRRLAYDLSLQDGHDGRSEWMSPAPGAPIVRVIRIQGPPPGYEAPAGRRKAGRRSNRRGRLEQPHSKLGWRGVLVLLWLTACPFVAFIWAARRQGALLVWAAFYLLVPAGGLLGWLAGSMQASLTARAVLLLGALHVICWRQRLLVAIERRSHKG